MIAADLEDQPSVQRAVTLGPAVVTLAPAEDKAPRAGWEAGSAAKLHAAKLWAEYLAADGD